MRHFSLTISALFLLACAASQPESRNNGLSPVQASGAQTETPDETVQATLTTQDGTSFERAIVIDAATEREGGTLEYRWVAEHFPSYRMQKQSLTKHEGRPYDILQITDASGAEHLIYFDISAYFGKR